MKLLECYIENFGALSDFKLNFSSGINCIKKDNGYGKTTLTVFIKAMLFGLDSTKRVKLENNDRKHYMPWQGGRCGGSLSFETGGKRYRIERTFTPKPSGDTFKLYDEQSGKESLDYSENVGEELFGIDVDGFERTVFLSEANLSGKNENKTVSAKLSNLVGYDGDLSAMDEAIELLEKNRKIYYKMGGTGEIGEIKNSITAIDMQINDLLRLKAQYSDKEIALKETNAALKNLYEEKNKLICEAKKLDDIKIKSTYIKQYNEMQASLDADLLSVKALSEFFKMGIPTHEEIERIREASLEAKRLHDISYTNDSADFIALREFFEEDLPSDEYERARHIKSKIEAHKSLCTITENELNSLMAECENAPQNAEEIDRYIRAISAKSAKKTNKSIHFWLLSLVFIAISVILGSFANPLFFIVSALAIPFAFLAIKSANSQTEKVQREAIENASAFLSQVYDDAPKSEGDVLAKLFVMRAKASEQEQKVKKISNLTETLNAQKEELNVLFAGAQEFISKFPKASSQSVPAALEEILRKRDIYIALLSSKNHTIAQREKDLRAAKEYADKVNEFLAKFPTKSKRPFDEISSKLLEYNSLLRSTERMKVTLDEFAREHDISSEIQYDEGASLDNAAHSAALEEKIFEYERSKAVAEKELNSLSESISQIDELTEEKEALSEKLKDCQDKLDVILMTKQYLSEAKDSLTSKYLSKTKAAFDKYVNLIWKASGEEFKMDTSFAVMKNERGSYKEAAAYSRGERDLLALAARLALVDSLYENESPFIILDDPFIYFDDTKLSRALSVLEGIAKEKQILYFTCSASRNLK